MTKTTSGVFADHIVREVFERKLNEVREACAENSLPFSKTQMHNATRKLMADELALHATLRYGDVLRDTLPGYMNVDAWVMPARSRFLDAVTIIEHPPLERGGPVRYRLVLR